MNGLPAILSGEGLMSLIQELRQHENMQHLVKLTEA